MNNDLSRDYVFMARSSEAVRWEIEKTESIRENDIFSTLNTALVKCAGRKVTFFWCGDRERRFPQIFRTSGNPDVVNVRYFVPIGQGTELISEDVLRQLSIATVLVCSFADMVDNLPRSETYASFSEHHPVHARYADEIYHALLKKFRTD